MEMTFLAAPEPLVKEFKDGKLLKSYPQITNVTSYRIHIKGMDTMLEALSSASRHGNALFRGSMKYDLHDESRAGNTAKGKDTEWFMLDIDSGEWDSPMQIVRALPENFSAVSYISHPSSSYLVTKDYWCGHLYFRLDRPLDFTFLKEYTKILNFKYFKNSITLNKIGTALKWPIDISVNDPSRIIYIGNAIGGHDHKFVLHQRSHKRLVIPQGQNKITDNQIGTLINKLRKANGYKSQRRRFDTEDQQLQTNVDSLGPGEYVHKDDGDFQRFNLRGGDSWAYYHPTGSPAVIHNFKGEPRYPTERLLPDYWAKIQASNSEKEHRSTAGGDNTTEVRAERVDGGREERDRESSSITGNGSKIDRREGQAEKYGERASIDTGDTNGEDRYTEGSHQNTGRQDKSSQEGDRESGSDKRLIDGTEILEFLDKNTKTYIVGPVTEYEEYSSKDQANQALVFYGRGPLREWPIGYRQFEPNVSWRTQYDDRQRLVLNTYIPTDIIVVPSDVVPTPIQRLILHIVGNGKDEYEHFIHWLAGVVQGKRRLGTAWLFSGVQGTGKGVFFNSVLRPIIGVNNCELRTLESIEDRFNDFLRDKLILFLDEFRLADSKYKAAAIKSKMKSWIGEEFLPIRSMRQTEYLVRNNLNIMMATNTRDAYEMDLSDRRINVGIYQNTPLLTMMTQEEIKDIHKHAPAFAGYLNQVEVDYDRLYIPLDNKARVTLRDVTNSAPDEVAAHLAAGDWDYFLDELPDPGVPHAEAQDYYSVMKSVHADCLHVQSTPQASDVKLTRTQIVTIFKYLTSRKFDDMGAKSVGKYLRARGIDLQSSLWIDGRTQTGMVTGFKACQRSSMAFGPIGVSNEHRQRVSAEDESRVSSIKDASTSRD